MSEATNSNSSFDQEQISCGLCGASGGIKSTITQHTFKYGSGSDEVSLSVMIPVRTCSACGSEFLDAESEAIKHDAVCRHLGVLTPSNIRQLRGLHRLSRVDFAKLTKLGEATLGRWERGSLIQNSAYDQYLFLLGFADNVHRLKERSRQTDLGGSGADSGSAPAEPRLRIVRLTEELRRESEQFSLSA